MKSCLLCINCGEFIDPYIRCDEPSLVESCEPGEHDFREFDPSFAEECEDFKPKKSK